MFQRGFRFQKGWLISDLNTYLAMNYVPYSGTPPGLLGTILFPRIHASKSEVEVIAGITPAGLNRVYFKISHPCLFYPKGFVKLMLTVKINVGEVLNPVDYP